MISVSIIWRFPITKERQKRLRTALEKRVARRAAAQVAQTEIRLFE